MLFSNVDSYGYSERRFRELKTFQRIKSKNPKKIRQETILLIVEICDSLEIPPQIFLAMGDVESGGKFNPLLYADMGHINTCYLSKRGHWSSGSIFQIGNNYTKRYGSDTENVCKDVERHCLYLSIPAIWNKLQYSKNIIEKKMGVWHDYYYYSRIHNPGHAKAGLDNAVVRKFNNKLKYWEEKVHELRNIVLYRKLKEQFEDVNPKDIAIGTDTAEKDKVNIDSDFIKKWLNTEKIENEISIGSYIKDLFENRKFIYEKNICYFV